jgi:hypothetical protein
MANSSQGWAAAIPVFLGFLAILVCLARWPWIIRRWNGRGFHIKAFEKLSSEAEDLCAETAKAHKTIVQDEVLDTSIKKACLEIVNAANEYDTGIRIALATWEDMIPTARDSDAEMGKEEEDETRKKHRRYVIATMRKRIADGMGERRRLSLQMQWMLANVVPRYVLHS